MNLDKQILTVEWTSLESVHCSSSNPRRNEAAVPHVLSSLKRFGWQQPIVARKSGEVIAGNTRLKAARELGLTHAPVVWFTGSDTEAVAYQIADNRTHEFAEWNEVELAALLETLRAEDALEGVGFNDAEIDQFLAEIRVADLEVLDPGPGIVPAGPVTQLDDCWLVGDHKLLCGDLPVFYLDAFTTLLTHRSKLAQ